jgi:diguanylate cyclase (GGDEF)-like protein
MAAKDPNPRPDPLPPGRTYLSASALHSQLLEEVNRAARHGTQLSCLLVVIDNLQDLSREHGNELLEQTLAYVGQALTRNLRNFDRVGRPAGSELMVLLPGADGPRGEVVARRVLKRLETIKLETDGTRRPLRISVGLAAWREDFSGEDLLTQSRAAVSTVAGPNSGGPPPASYAGTEPPDSQIKPLAVGLPPRQEPPQPS